MRTLFGIILGAGITVGAAYVHDTLYAKEAPAAPGAMRTIVNWDVASEVTGNTLRLLRAELDKLLGK